MKQKNLRHIKILLSAFLLFTPWLLQAQAVTKAVISGKVTTGQGEPLKGATVQVETLDGKKVAIKIPPGTPSGKRFRVRGQGIQKGEKKGDLIVEVSIQVPEKLSEEQERMMKEFAESGGMKY